jgi:hypothetical protein
MCFVKKCTTFFEVTDLILAFQFALGFRRHQMKLKLLGLVVLLPLLLDVVPTYAHHSDAAYQTTSIELKNVTVVKLVWANPHGILSFDVKDGDGKVKRWAAEMGSPSSMFLVGWNRNSLSPGDVVTIYMYPARNGTPLGRLARVVYPDGKVLNYRDVR